MTTKIAAKVVLDSINATGSRITTLQLVYPRFIHAEAKTHRMLSIGDNAYELLQEVGFMDDPMLSRNASSSRAIPVKKVIEQVRSDPAMPVHWGANQPGMQANGEVSGDDRLLAELLWREGAMGAAHIAELMMNLGLHKQVANRILEPFQWMHVIVTATDWDNYFKLRLHPAAEPNIQWLAEEMKVAMDTSTPVRRDFHAPYVALQADRFDLPLGMVSAARCARVSYLNHDGTDPSRDKDAALAQTLRQAGHASPFEHVAVASPDNTRHANLRGWQSLRTILEI